MAKNYDYEIKVQKADIDTAIEAAKEGKYDINNAYVNIPFIRDGMNSNLVLGVNKYEDFKIFIFEARYAPIPISTIAEESDDFRIDIQSNGKLEGYAHADIEGRSIIIKIIEYK
jgi:hypothetical protein